MTRYFRVILLFGILGTVAVATQTAKDPGVRGGQAGAGGPIPGLPPRQRDVLFPFLTDEFTQLHSIAGTVPNETGNGLGPGYNALGCGTCHSFPAFGGSSPFVNPMIEQATIDGATNVVPSFETIDGPIIETRFKRHPADGTPDNQVHNIFSIKGRVDAPGCAFQQPDIEAQVRANNVAFRIPTPMFGAGFIENIPDWKIMANKAADRALKTALGIRGHENRNGNDGTITRFGWKAQNKSLTMFSGEAYLVEMGVTNDLFQNERTMAPGCNFNTQPEDHTLYNQDQDTGGGTSGMQHFATFGRLLAAPQPDPPVVPGSSQRRGLERFVQIGCSLCHTPMLQTSTSDLDALNRKPANLFSDLLVHNMGSGLADGITQGNAGPSEFRTAPLWGAGQRIFFLHDGRTTDLIQAIVAHKSPGSEASKVVDNYLGLTESQKQDLLNFLRSL